MAGLDGSLLLDAHRTWGSYVLGYVVVEQRGRRAEREWRPPIRADFPISAEIDAYQAARDWDEQFGIGLKLIFDGIAARAGTADRRPPTADRRPPTADRRPPTADRRPPTADR